MKKLLVATLLASISLSAAAAEKIRFATEASYPPFEFVGADNTIQGIRLLEEIIGIVLYVRTAF